MKNGMKQIYLSVIVVVLLVIFCAGIADAMSMHIVNRSGDGDYINIQDAIDNATSGDTILVYSGIYYENVNITKRLILKGMDNGSGYPIVDASGSGDAITLSAAGITIEDFLATSAPSSYAGIKIISDDNTIHNFNSSNNINGKGISILSSRNNTIANSDLNFNYYGIYLEGSDNNTLENNNLYSNNYYGIYLDNSNSNFIIDNNVSNNYQNFYVYYSNNNNIINNNGSDGYYGFYLRNSNNNSLTENIAIQNSYGIYLDYSNYNNFTANNFSNNEYGVFLDYQDYNNNLVNNDVSSNSYYNIYLYSSANNNLANNNASKSKYDYGIYLQNSDNNSLSNNDLSSNAYYNIYLYSSSYNNITNNNASNGGYGLYMGYGNYNDLSNNDFSANSYENIELYRSSYNNITYNNASNGDYGVYLNWYSNYNNISKNILNTNRNDAVYIYYSSNNYLRDNDILSNGNNGIFISRSGNNNLKNNTIAGNNYNFKLDGNSDSDFNNTIDTSNLVDGKPVYYLLDVANTVYDSSSDPGVFYCIRCDNVTIKDAIFTKNYYGVFFWNTRNSRLLNISSHSNNDGVFLSNTNNIDIVGSDISGNNGNGIYLTQSNNNNIIHNNLLNNSFGIYLSSANTNNINGNNASGKNYGIYLYNSNNNNITENNADNNDNGIYLFSSNYNNISENNVASNVNGIYLYNSINNDILNINVSHNSNGITIAYSGQNILENNIMLGNNYSFGLLGYDQYTFNNTIDTSNTADGKPIYYIENGENIVYDASSNAAVLYCITCDNVTIRDSDLLKNYYGIFFWNTRNSNIENITSSNNYYGIYVSSSNDNNITGSNLNNNAYGIYFTSSNNNSITNNSIGMNNYGITLSDSNSNGINNNIVLGNRDLDFNVYSSMNSGDNNTCDKPDGWNDNGVTGCMNLSRDRSTYPDLVVSEISWSPPNFNVTDSVAFNVTVKNVGSGDFSGELYVGLYINGVFSSEAYKITNLSTNQDENFTIHWYVSQGGANSNVTAKADYNNHWAEFNDSNNDLTVPLPNIGGPDLIVENITWSPDPYSAGQYVTFTATVRNIGETSTQYNYNYVRFYIDGNYISDNYFYGSVAPDASFTVTSYYYAWQAMPGTHTVKAYADVYNYVTEKNESNNDLNVSLPYVSGPDYIVENITWSPGTFSGNDYVTFTATVRNIGNGSSSQYSYVRYYIDGISKSTNYMPGSLAPNATTTVTYSWQALPGNHSVKAYADIYNYVYETNETNNDLNVSLPYASGPDFIIENITWSPNSYSGNQYVTFTATVRNIGDRSSQSAYNYVRFYINGNYITQNYFYGSLAPNANFTVDSYSWQALPGNHTVKAYADIYNYVIETNETNNDLSIALPYAPGPDLVITNINWTPNPYNPGDTVTFFANVTNIGDVSTGNNYDYVGFYVDGTYIGYNYRYGDIGIGQNITLSRTWTAQGGNHSVTAKVDDPYCCGNNIFETNETNNDLTVDLPRADLPDLVITDLSWSPFNYAAGDPIVLNATVENNGSGIWNGPVRVDFYYKNTTYITSTSPSMSLPPGGVKYATITWSAAQAGDFYFRAQVDRYNYIQELNESNNDYYARSTALMPDLTVDSISLKVEHRLIPRGDQNDNIFWKYNTTTPDSGWQNLSFDDSNWSMGKAPIGNTGSVRTSLDIGSESGYFRKVFNLTSIDNITLYIASASGIDVWVNGIQVLAKTSDNHWYNYWDYQVDITPYVQPGQNVLAIYLRSYADCWWGCYYYNYLDTEITNYTIASPESANINAGDTVIVNATIKNTGQGNLSSWGLYNYLYIDGSSYTSFYKTMILPANGTDYATFTWPATSGSHSIRVFADVYNYINEGNESNNDLIAYLRPIAYPDLIVEDIYWSPQNYTSNQIVTLYATIRNIGPGYASGFYTMFYVDGSYLNYYGTNYPGIIPPGGSVNVTQTWTASGGSHTVRIRTDYSNYYGQRIAELSENNNERTESLTPIYYPDIVITGVTASKGGVIVNISDLNASDGESVTFNATIKNIGLGNISTTNLYVNFNIDGSYVTQGITNQELPVNGTANISAVWTATPGTHTFLARADPNNYILESNENNNEYSANLNTIQYSDLIVTDLTWTPSNYSDGQVVTFNANIENIGPGNTTRSFYTRFLIDGNDIGGPYITGIASGSSRSVSQTWTVTPGEHKVKAFVDIWNYVSESNESNNTLELNLTRVDQSDLIVSDLIWTPSDFSDGNTLTFTAVVQNIGLGNTTRGFYTRFLIDGSGIGDVSLPGGLAAGYSASVTRTWTATPGEHLIKAVADIYSQVPESNETNNTLELNLTRIDPPDLIVSNLTWSPSNFSDGEVVHFNATIQNIGVGNTTRAFYARLMLDGVDIGGPYISGLLSGESISFTQSWTATPGEHKIRGSADHWNYVYESNETNNSIELNLTKVEPADLTITDISWSPSNFSDGQVVTFNAVVKNIGNGNTTRAFYTRFFIDGVDIGGPYRTGLASGSMMSVTQTWTATTGEHKIKAVADNWNYVSESNETNNSLELNLTKVDPADLIVTALSWTPSNISDGQTVTFHANVNNTGSGNTTRGFYIRFLIDGTDKGGPYISGLSSGSTISASYSWTAEPGEHKIKAVADFWNSVSESNETNNSIEFDLPRIEQSDLVVSSLTWSPLNISDGQGITFNSVITNIGTGNVSRGFYVRFLIDGSYIGERYISGIASGSSSSVSQTWTATPGEHNISAIVDFYNHISESNETNNTAVFNLSKVDQADLQISGIVLTPSTFSDGETVTFRASINNADKGNTTRGFYVRFLIDNVHIGEKYISGLNSGSTAEVVQVWPASPGTHALKIVADQYNHISESNETNNTVTLDLPEVLRSDLNVSGLSWTPATFSDGERVTLNATIRNIGANTTRKFYAQFNIEGGCAGNILVSGVGAGESKDVSLVWIASGGHRNLTVIADPDGYITESNRDNNNLSSELPEVLMPDLNITGIDWSPKNPGAGDNVLFNITVSNIGTGNTSRNSGVQLDINGEYFQRTLINGLGAGKSVTIDLPKTWVAKYGVNNIKVIADSTGSMTESDETNNNYSLDLNVVDNMPPTLSSINPSNGSISSNISNVTVLLSDGTGSGVNLESSEISIRLGVVGISGIKSINGNYLIFTPISSFIDGDYNVSISAVDNTTNSRTIQTSFTIDTIPPAIEISGVNEGALYNDPVVPVIIVSDPHLLSTTIKLNGIPFLSGTSINTDGKYHLSIESADAAGNKASRSVNFIVDAKPSAPTGLRMSRLATTSDLIWNPNIELDISGYNVYRNGVKINGDLIADNEYRDIGLSPGVDYLYNVTAVDAAGQESDKAGLSPIRIKLDRYGSLIEGTYYLTGEFPDTVNFSIINDGTANLNIRSVLLEGLDPSGNVTFNVSENPFTIGPSSTRSISKIILTGNRTDRLSIRVRLSDDSWISRIFYVNVRRIPGRVVEMTAPTIIEGYRDRINLKIMNYGSASLGIDPKKVGLLLKDANGRVLSEGRGEGLLTWIEPNSSQNIRAFVNTPVAEGDIELKNLSIDTSVRTLYDNMKNGTIFNISEDVSSKYQTVKPIDIYHSSLIKGTDVQFDAVLNNQGTEDLTVDDGNARIFIRDLNGTIISSGSYDGWTYVVIHDGSEKFRINVPIPADAPDIISIEAVVLAGYWTIDGSAVPIRFNVTSFISTVKPDYNANAGTDKLQYNRGENITISGIAKYENGSIVANSPVLLKIRNKGFERKTQVTTDDSGNYNYVFQPLYNEAGKYIISATHPSVREIEIDAQFEIIGLYTDPQNILLSMSKNSMRSFPIQVKNIGESDISNIQLTVIDEKSGDGVIASAEGGTFNLAPKEIRSMNIFVESELVSADNATFIIRAMGDNGSSANSTFRVNLYPAEPIPGMEPRYIHTGANPGTVEVKTVKIHNYGYLTQKNVTVSNATNPWITVVNDPVLGDIAPGENKTFDVMINPGTDVPLGAYNDALRITSDNYADITYQVGVFITSDKMGTLKFVVKNQFGDILPNAEVSIIDMETYTVAMKNTTDLDGIAVFFGIPSGRYSYKVDALYHDDVVGNVFVDIGTSTTIVDITSVYNFLEVEWTVTPTTIKDVYDITHNITYNTTVPVPYIKMDIVSDTIYMVPGAVYYGNVTLTNMNDIVTAVNGMPFGSSNNELVSVEFLVDNIPELKPHESVTIPFVVKLATHHSPTPRACDTFQITIVTRWDNVPCPSGVGTFSVPGDTLTLNIKPSCIEMVRDIALCAVDVMTACVGTTATKVAGTIGAIAQGQIPGEIKIKGYGVGACLSAVANCRMSKFQCSGFAVGDCIDNVANCLPIPCNSCVSAVNSIVKCLFQDQCCEEPPDETPPPPYTPPSYTYFGGGGIGPGGGGGWGGGGGPFTGSNCFASPSKMCVKIRIEIKQELAFERQAFEAELKLKNVLPDYDMTNVSINITFRNTTGSISNHMFFKNITGKENIMSAENGNIDALSTATLNWLIIPTPGAGGQVGEKYSVSATINYSVNGVEFTTETWPDEITVEPMPRLTLDYVLPKKVIGDDPDTEGIIEPVVPFMFGVRVNNSGFGPANNLAIDSAQPQIVDANAKTNIQFRLLGTYVNGTQIPNTLKINFGNMQPKSCKAAGWQMMVSVTGYFSNYSATFKHADSLGGEATSLLDAINTHVLVHEFINDQPGNDSMYDFILDANNDSVPDLILDSACSDEPITVVPISGSNSPTVDNPVLNVTVSGSAQGWGYMSMNDPMDNAYPILKIVRSDGYVLSRYNYWMQEDTIFFVDYNPSDRYRIVYKVPLLISNVQVKDLSTESAKITWDTDRPSDSIVKYGTHPGVYNYQKKNVTVSGSHIVNLNELVQNTTYYYVVNSTHPSGNTNESVEFNFTTLKKEDTNLILSINAPPGKESNRSMIYTLYYANMGGAVAENVTINDTLSDDVVFISASDGGSFDPGTKNVTWNIANVAGYPAGLGSVNVTVKIKPVATGTVIINKASINTSNVEVRYDDNIAQAQTKVKAPGLSLPENANVEPNNGGIGIPSVYWGTPTNFKLNQDAISVNIKIQVEGQSPETHAMSGESPNWAYSTTFYPQHGRATITYTINYPDGSSDDVPFDIYIDPAGYIYDVDTGARIQNATVWLQQPDGFGGWDNVSTGLAIAIPDVNPLTTGVDGQYQWDVIRGIYRVHVEASEYYPENSSFVSVPPPVTDLHVGLRHFPDVTAPGKVVNLHNITFAPTYINWTWTDPADADIDHVEVYIDNGFKENATKGKQYYNAIGFTPDSEHMISTRTVDNRGNVNYSWQNHTARTAIIADTTAPDNVSDLHNITYQQTYINWTWADPADTDFDHVEIYIDNGIKVNVPKGIELYHASGFSQDTEHTLSTRTVDTSGNVNSNWRNHTARTAISPDNTAPASVTGLHNITYEHTYINWTWTDPADADFAWVEVYINSVWEAIVQKGQQYFNATLLAPDTAYTISTRTVDTNGNVNDSWENRTARTAPTSVPSDSTAPVITNIAASSISTDSAVISWDTDEASNSSVSYDTSSGSYSTTISSSSMVSSHSISLTGLSAETKYYYVVKSADANDNSAQSIEFNFTTQALPDTIDPVIESVVVYPANTTAGSKVDIKVAASDNKEVTGVTADGHAFTYSDGSWNGNITASSSLGTYDVLIRAADAAGNDAQTSVKYTVVNKVGGIAITSIPKPLSIVRGSSGQLNIKLISTANIDDRVWVNITTTGISATSAINLAWFNRTAVLVEVPSKATVYVPFRVSVPADAGVGYKTFKNNAKSTWFNATSVDTGVVNVR